MKKQSIVEWEDDDDDEVGDEQYEWIILTLFRDGATDDIVYLWI